MEELRNRLILTDSNNKSDIIRLSKMSQQGLLDLIKNSSRSIKMLDKCRITIDIKELAIRYFSMDKINKSKMKISAVLLKDKDVIECMYSYDGNDDYIKDIDLTDKLVHPAYFYKLDDHNLLNEEFFNAYIAKYPEYKTSITKYRDDYEKRKSADNIYDLPYSIRNGNLFETILNRYPVFQLSNTSKYLIPDKGVRYYIPADKELILNLIKLFGNTAYSYLENVYEMDEDMFYCMLGNTINPVNKNIFLEYIEKSLYILNNKRWKLLNYLKPNKIYDILKDNKEIYEITPTKISYTSLGNEKIELYDNLLKLEPRLINKFDETGIKRHIDNIKDIRHIDKNITKKYITNIDELVVFDDIGEYLEDELRFKLISRRKKSARK